MSNGLSTAAAEWFDSVWLLQNQPTLIGALIYGATPLLVWAFEEWRSE